MDYLSFLLILLGSATAHCSLSSPVSCATNNTACDDVSDNLLDIYPGVGTIQLCRQICLDQAACNFFTYYGEDSFPLRRSCSTFTSCPSVHQCNHCVSEDKDCMACGENKVGPIDSNLLDFSDSVESEGECKMNCMAHPDCLYYTYFTEEDAEFPKFCFLLTELLEPVISCDSCMTGPRSCRITEAILSTGGWTEETSTEIFVPSTGFQCYLPDLPRARNGAVAVGNAVCGGNNDGWYDYDTTCITLGKVSINLQKQINGLVH